jgi:hypothetical protein
VDRYTIGPVLGFLIIVVAISFLVGFVTTTKLRIFNTFKYNVNLELKCNYNTIKKRFMYHKYYNLKGNSYMDISIPNNSDCQIWPKLR